MRIITHHHPSCLSNGRQVQRFVHKLLFFISFTNIHPYSKGKSDGAIAQLPQACKFEWEGMIACISVVVLVTCQYGIACYFSSGNVNLVNPLTSSLLAVTLLLHHHHAVIVMSSSRLDCVAVIFVTIEVTSSLRQGSSLVVAAASLCMLLELLQSNSWYSHLLKHHRKATRILCMLRTILLNMLHILLKTIFWSQQPRFPATRTLHCQHPQ